MTLTRSILGLTFVLALVPAPSRAQGSDQVCLAPISTEFDPQVDGLAFVNTGDFGGPFGNCWGMSLLSIHQFHLRRAGGLDAVAAEVVHPPLEADVLEQIVASLVQAEASRTLREGDSGMNPVLPLDDPSGVRAALDRIRSTGEPEVLIYFNAEAGHANVLFGYDGLNLLVYDPNMPLQTIKWPWTAAEGFGPHPSGGSFYGTLQTLSSTPFAQFTISSQLEALRQSCIAEQEVCVGRYPGVTARIYMDAEDRAVVVGMVRRPAVSDNDGEEPPALGTVWASINGQPLAQANVTRRVGLQLFALRLPKGTKLDAARQVRLILLSEDGRFAGYTDVAAHGDPVVVGSGGGGGGGGSW